MIRIDLSDEEYFRFESFFQYGNLKSGRYIFVGREEGLNEQEINRNFKGRQRWLMPDSPLVTDGHIHYLGEEGNYFSGYYIDEAWKADWIRLNPDLPYLRFKDNLPTINVLRSHARIMVLLTNDISIIHDRNLDQIVTSYYKERLYTPEGNTHMLDFLGMPRQGAIKFMHREMSTFPEEPSEHRKQLLKMLYDSFPMPINIVYAGKRDKQFRTKAFYQNLGFDFTQSIDTGTPHPDYLNVVKPSARPKIFEIGTRIRPSDGQVQIVFLTPFFMGGGSNFSYDDIDVLTTWIKSYDEITQ